MSCGLHRRGFLCSAAGLVGGCVARPDAELGSADVALPPELLDAVARGAVAPRSAWTAEQWRGRRRLERIFERRGLAVGHREYAFVGLVAAAREGSRGRRMIRRAAEHLRGAYGEPPDWVRILSVLFQVASLILTILLLFV